MARRFQHDGWDVVIEEGSVAISNKPAVEAARQELIPNVNPEPQRVVVPDSLIDAISDKLPPRTMREEGRV